MTEDKHLEHILGRIASDRSADAPVDTVKYIKNLFAPHAATSEPSLVKRIVASLTSNIQQGTLVFGERSGSAAQAHQMLFEAGEYAIDLRVSKSGRSLSVRGQLLGDGLEGASIELSGATQKDVTVDDWYGFEIPGVQPGEYTLLIKTADSHIVIEDLLLK